MRRAIGEGGNRVTGKVQEAVSEHGHAGDDGVVNRGEGMQARTRTGTVNSGMRDTRCTGSRTTRTDG